MPSVNAKIKQAGVKTKPKRDGPLWSGPSGEGPQGGITFSLLSRFLVCRERFRVHVIEGLRPNDKFNDKLEFGSMWHVCEEAHAANLPIEGYLVEYAEQLRRKYQDAKAREEIAHWAEVCLELFPRYVEYWSQHPDVLDRTPLLQEQPFDVPYRLPSGRTVRLRGKWDSVDLIGKGKAAGIYLQENKTKSSVDGVKIARQCSFDLQTMMYLVALGIEKHLYGPGAITDGPNGRTIATTPLLGVRYNVVRRSAHKTVESMLKKMGEDQRNGRIGEWFGRWKVEVSAADVARFRRECLDPVLEQLCDWWGWCRLGDPYRPKNSGSVLHWRHPFGVYNVLNEGGFSDIDSYLETGSESGLRRADDLFPELI